MQASTAFGSRTREVMAGRARERDGEQAGSQSRPLVLFACGRPSMSQHAFSLSLSSLSPQQTDSTVCRSPPLLSVPLPHNPSLTPLVSQAACATRFSVRRQGWLRARNVS